MKNLAIVACLFVAGTSITAGGVRAQSNRIVLITADEAKRPASSEADLTFRAGVSRGPLIETCARASFLSMRMALAAAVLRLQKPWAVTV